MTDPHVIRRPEGTITIAADVLEEIVRRATEQAHGARAHRPRRRLDVDVDGTRARVSLGLAVRYGVRLPDAAEEVQRRVAGALREMCELEAEVDVVVEELE